MRKYTVYEIEKLTNGKISKYKLNQAIEKGELKAEFVPGDKHGRGIPKYFVFENDLNEYLKKLHNEKKKIFQFPEDDANKKTSQDMTKLVDHLIKEKEDIIQSKNSVIEELKLQIKQLETQNENFKPLIESIDKKNQDQENSKKELRDIALELSELSFFSLGKKKHLVKRIHSLL